MMVRKLTSALIGAGMLLPGFAGALGLGGIELKSALNQPLDADIKLSKVGDLIEDEIRIKLAGYDDFEKAGVERVFFLTGLKFDVEIKPDGTGVIHVSSKKPVKEPFLNFIIEMQWPQGRLLREYTVLMDPPIFNQQAEGLITSPPVSVAAVESPIEEPTQEAKPVVEPIDEPEEIFSEAPIEDIDTGSDLEDLDDDLDDDFDSDWGSDEPIASAETKEDLEVGQFADNDSALDDAEDVISKEYEKPEPVATVAQQPQWRPSSPPTGTYGRVSRSDNLWQISKKVKPAGVTPQQTMLAIKKLNSEAFFNDNINNLKEGVILRLPTLDQIQEIDAATAVNMVAVQNRQWFEEKGEDLSAVPLDTGVYSQVKSVSESEGEARLKLLAANADADAEGGALGSREGDFGGASVSQLEEALLAVEENLDRSKLENQELSSRLSDLESQIQTSEEILQLKDNQIAALQAKLKELEQQAGMAVGSENTTQSSDIGTDTDSPVDNTAESPGENLNVSVDESATEPVVESKTEPSSTGDGIVADTASLPDPTANQQPLQSTPVTAEQNVAKNQSLLDQVLAKAQSLVEASKSFVSNPMYLLAGGGGLILLLSGVFMLLRKSKKDDEAFESEGFDDDLEYAFDEQDKGDTTDDFNLAEDEEEAISEAVDEEAPILAAETADARETLEEFQGTAADAIGEADIYIAYGRYSHAMDLLKQALVKESDHLGLKKKLLEVYGEMDDEAAYSALEAEIHALESTGGASDEMTLRAASTPHASQDEDDEMDFSMDLGEENEASPEAMQANLEAVENELETSFDFGDDDGSELASNTNASDDSDILTSEEDDFNLDDASFAEDLGDELEGLGLDDGIASANDEAEELEFSLEDEENDDVLLSAESVAGADLDQDENLDLEDLAFDSDEVEVAQDSVDEGLDLEPDVFDEAPEALVELDEVEGESLDTNFEMESAVEEDETLAAGMDTADGFADDDDDFDFLNDADEAATKLDLARAYIDMGDKDGARDILEEVLSEGDEQQKKDANELLQRIA